MPWNFGVERRRLVGVREGLGGLAQFEERRAAMHPRRGVSRGGVHQLGVELERGDEVVIHERLHRLRHERGVGIGRRHRPRSAEGGAARRRLWKLARSSYRPRSAKELMMRCCSLANTASCRTSVATPRPVRTRQGVVSQAGALAHATNKLFARAANASGVRARVSPDARAGRVARRPPERRLRRSAPKTREVTMTPSCFTAG